MFATLPSLRLSDVRIDSKLVTEHERMLTGGFYAEIALSYDSAIALESKGRPFGIETMKEIQLSRRDVLEILEKARSSFSTDEWKKFLLRSIGIEADNLTERQMDAFLLRMVPFVERNYNMVELGPGGSVRVIYFSKYHLCPSYLWRQGYCRENVVNNSADNVDWCACTMFLFRRNFRCVVDQKGRRDIMKGYMESGEFSRGKESIRADEAS